VDAVVLGVFQRPKDNPMAQPLLGKTIAVLATDGVEQSELTEPVKALKGAGAQVHVVAPRSGTIQAWHHAEKGDRLGVDLALANADPERFDALVLPGGLMNPDQLRVDPRAVAFVRGFVEAFKPIAAICHGPWTLIEAGGVKGRRVTSWPSLKTDLTNAGAEWTDEAVVVDRGLVTSRKPDDLPAFNAKMIEEFSEGRHAQAAE
jgi:protease I